MSEKKQKDLLKVQQYVADCIPVYEMLEEKIKDVRIRDALKKIREQKQLHISLLEKETGTSLTAKKGDSAFFKVLKGVFGAKRTLKMMGESEMDAAKDHTKILADYPRLKRIAQDEQRHGETLLRLKNLM